MLVKQRNITIDDWLQAVAYVFELPLQWESSDPYETKGHTYLCIANVVNPVDIV